MPLTPGGKLGEYEILAPLGAGGMGQVWRAKDRRLGREVAIKVLPDAVAGDAERVQRFGREARHLAALNHPNIAQIYGFDESDRVVFLVLELVEGEDLAQRIARGPLPLAEASDVARQVAEALEAAHERGIVHRDLKPANIRITPEGTVKVLDFGLAKAFDTTESRPGPDRGSAFFCELATAAPKSPAGPASLEESLGDFRTVEGVVLGTPTYMAPEQARGRPIDKRVDVWAFGCVLYECLTGQRAFEGGSVSDVLAAIIERDPDWTKLPAATPPRVRELLERCLEKDARCRLRDIGEARFTFERGSALSRAGVASSPRHEPPRMRPSIRGVAPWLVGAVLGASATFLALRTPEAPSRAPESIGYSFAVLRARESARFPLISPDGRFLVSEADDGLWIRALDERAARRLEGTERGTFPFWSPDSRQIGFFVGGKLKRVGVAGAPPVTMAECPLGWPSASWSSDGTILVELTESSETDGWYVIDPGASSPRKIREFPHARPIGPDRAFPSFLPDGRHFLFTEPFEGVAWLQVGSLDSTETRRLTTAGSGAHYVEPGFLLYVRDSVLLAHAFDARTLELHGDPIEIERGLEFFAPTGTAQFSASQQGTLVLRRRPRGFALKWYDRDGRELGTVLRCETQVRGFDLTPDDQQVVYSLVDARDGTTDLWLFDMEREVPTRLTSAARGEYWPVWDPKGRRVVFSADAQGPPNLQLLETTGASYRELVPFDRQPQYTGSWTPDGASVVYASASKGRDIDLWIVDIASHERRELLATEFAESMPRVSPDGRRLAFVSNASGRNEVYVALFAMVSERVRLSVDGGLNPQWNPDGSELLFQSPDDAIHSVAIEDDGTGRLRAGRPKLLYHVAERTLWGWRVARDGKRFLLLVQDREEASASDDVFVNWPRLLRR